MSSDRVSNEKKNLNRLAGEFLVASRLAPGMAEQKNRKGAANKGQKGIRGSDRLRAIR
jgi:hypothetical protein